MQAQQEEPEEPLYNGWKLFVRELEEEAAAKETIRTRVTILVRQLERRGFMDPAIRERVLACSDVEQLDTWLDRVLVASTAAEVFAA